jgi:hypothetical protein
LLDEDLRIIREISTKFQAELIATRLAQTPEDKQNKFQPGDLVLFQLNPDQPKPTKLTSPYLGPYEVLRQVKNDVEVRHVSLGVVKQFHVTIEIVCRVYGRSESYSVMGRGSICNQEDTRLERRSTG